MSQKQLADGRVMRNFAIGQLGGVYSNPVDWDGLLFGDCLVVGAVDEVVVHFLGIEGLP